MRKAHRPVFTIRKLKIRNKDGVNEFVSVALGAMSVIAILGILVKKDFETNEVFGSVINFTQVGIPLLVLLITARVSRRSKNWVNQGREGLERVRNRYKKILQGPELEKTEYTPDEEISTNKRHYLFFKEKKYKKVKFVPLEPLERGILDIRISKESFKNFYCSNDDVEKRVENVKAEIYKNLNEYLSHRYRGLYKINPKHDYSAIIIDFDQDNLKPGGLKSAVYNCTSKALKIFIESIPEESHRKLFDENELKPKFTETPESNH
jgi:hypothetical protein